MLKVSYGLHLFLVTKQNPLKVKVLELRFVIRINHIFQYQFMKQIEDVEYIYPF